VLSKQQNSSAVACREHRLAPACAPGNLLEGNGVIQRALVAQKIVQGQKTSPIGGLDCLSFRVQLENTTVRYLSVGADGPAGSAAKIKREHPDWG
jgi:hypothetical protein